MVQVIAVTGTPATGKTTISRRLAEELGFEYLDVSGLIQERGLSEDHDPGRGCAVVDEDELTSAISDRIFQTSRDGVVVDSHLAHYLRPSLVTLCVVTKADLPVLRERLRGRGYPEEKVRENLDAEIFDLCYVEACEMGHEVELLDTSGDVSLGSVMQKLRHL